MRFTFLGTGTSAGVPLIACSCPVCTSDDPRDKRLRTSACLEFVDASGQYRVVLIDCGPDLPQQALRAGLTRCDAVVFTHNHVDHTFGVDELRRFNAAMHAAIDVYAESRTMEHLRRVYQHIFDSAFNVNQSFVATLIPHVIDENTSLELFGVSFTPIRLLHGRLPVLGFRIESHLPGADELLPLAYCTDVSAVPPGSWGGLGGLRTLVLDALRPRHHPTHLTLDQAVSIAERVTPERTWFVHMSHDLAHEATNASLPEGVRLAHDGLTLGSLDSPPGMRRVPGAALADD